MSTRGATLLAIGMLVLGLVLGAIGGGAAGYFFARGGRALVSQNVLPLQREPNQQLRPRGSVPATPTPQPGQGMLPPIQNLPVGARVIDVEQDGPAAKAGLQTGDVITAVDNAKLDDNHSLADFIQGHKPGDKIALAVTRGPQNLTLNVELGPAPQDSSSAYLGIRFSPTFGGGRRFQVPGNR